MYKQIIFLLFPFIFYGYGLYGQELMVHGSFHRDTVMIGEIISFSLTAGYPKEFEVIFPDSTYDFSPFEYDTRRYATTRTSGGISFDSVTYFLRTFEIDSIQYLQLPVYLKQVDDSAAVYSTRDSVVLDYVIREVSDTLRLRENTALFHIPVSLNYPMILILLAVLIILTIVVIMIFGKRMVRWYRLIMMKRKHKKFLQQFYNKLGGLRDGRAGVEPEYVLADWKRYMENVENEPYTKLTTKELIGLHADHRLKENLRSIDRYIYGGVKENPLYKNFEKLLEYSIERYELRLEEVKHG